MLFHAAGYAVKTVKDLRAQQEEEAFVSEAQSNIVTHLPSSSKLMAQLARCCRPSAV